MTHGEDESLDQLARAITGGERVDWASSESGAADDSTRQLIRELSVIAAISDVHCSIALPGDLHADTWTESVPESLETWGSFRLLEQVGTGAYGQVYRAWDTRLDREVALKLLPAELDDAAHATSIIEEGRLLARVRHPNVVTIYGAERIENRIGLWMEFVKGRTLEQIIQERNRLSESETVAIGLQLCRAVSAVHGAGLLHRDIKAHNVMQSEDGRIALMDFGTGRTLEEDAAPDLAGTPLYLAPEVLHGQQATVRSDIYSLGVVLFHLVTGSYPVRARTVRDMREAHERGEHTAVQAARRDVSAKLAQIIDRAIDPRPERRYESADALGADLGSLTPRTRIVRVATAAAAAVALVVLAGAGWEVAGRRMGSSRTPSALLLGFVNVSPAEQPVIAVLPFQNLSTGPDSDYFVDALADEIIRNLARVDGLRVVGRTSSSAFKDEPRNLRQIGERLGANLVVEGSVLRTGGQLRIRARLVKVAGDIPLWTGEYDRKFEDIFSIEDELSRAIVQKLRLTSAAGRQRYDANADAYDWYLRARALVDRRGMANAQKAAEFFERAIAEDPGFAPAYAGLANAQAFVSFPFQGLPFEKAYPIMRSAAGKALELDPLLPEAHAAMGWVYAYEREWANAEKAFQQSIRLNPSLTQTYTSYSISTLQPLQKYDEALRLLGLASRLDPLSLDVQREIGEVQLFGGRYAEAVETFHRVSEAEPDFPFVRAYLAKALIFAGRAPAAIPLLNPGAPWLAQAYLMTGRRAEAEQLAAEAEAYPYRLAVIAAALGDTDGAIEALERASVSEPHRIGRLLIEPELVAVRDHPRVIALRRAFNLPN
jgi:serine/threonine-protein kinase